MPERIRRSGNPEAIEFLRNTNRVLGRGADAGRVTMAEESTDFPACLSFHRRLGFGSGGTLRWMHDTLDLR